ncbi:Type III restriction protein res subunit [uncultured Desulfatiglans sp.]|nr:Type III restriction protein res subunit [uncultured Desulfatiglans sp.]
MDQQEEKPVIYRKLVRDRIPEIIREAGKAPFVQTLGDDEFRPVLGRKILEEAHELFSAWRAKDSHGVLTESADLLEAVLAALREEGFTFHDLEQARRTRAAERGCFHEKLFLEAVNGYIAQTASGRDTPAFLFNPGDALDLIELIRSELLRSTDAWIASAFSSPSAVNLLLTGFERFVASGGRLRLLLSTMGNVTRPEYLSHIERLLPGGEVRVFHPPQMPFDRVPPDFHVKAYLFKRRDGVGSVIIGSSNLTGAGLTTNIEWNYFTSSEINLAFEEAAPFEAAVRIFDQYWTKQSVPVSEDFLEGYRRRFHTVPESAAPKAYHPEHFRDKQVAEGSSPRQEPVHPNTPQIEALEKLAEMRAQGVERAAVIAATGIGKTYLAAFDFRTSGCRRMLFIAHRQTILLKAMESFRTVMNLPYFGALCTAEDRPASDHPAVFAMIQTLSRHSTLEKLPPDSFDYIVMDEFHHSQAATYRRVIEHFRPQFFLGLTATPERMDGRDVLAHCGYNIAYELRVLEAIERGWLTPFQYFAVYDETDYSRITWRGTQYDEHELDQALSTDTRTAVIARNLSNFLPSMGKIKALAFCSSIAHARYTARHLSLSHGIPARALLGEDSEETRQATIRCLRDEKDPLKVICSVDIFNEGVDIPELTHVLFLRPTQSFAVFLQQLGRGLRRSPGKDFLVAIDFVGNYRKVHVAPLALCGYTSIETFIKDFAGKVRPDPRKMLPASCFLDPELKVQRIWDDELKTILGRHTPLAERLKSFYLEIRENLGGRSPQLMDLFAAGYDIDPRAFISHFGNWLRAKLYCEDGRLDPCEKDILDTPGEAFLQHLEKDLRPVRSYKMVVLLSLLEMPGTQWAIEDIAVRFLNHFLAHPDHLPDYEDLARAEEPGKFPLDLIIRKLRKMPLHFLSNSPKDFFILDLNQNRFLLQQAVHPFWMNDHFRMLVRDRATFALAEYFRRKALRQTVYAGPDVTESTFKLRPELAELLLGARRLPPGGEKLVRVKMNGEKWQATLRRSSDGRSFYIQSPPGSPYCSYFSQSKDGSTDGQRLFRIKYEKDTLVLILQDE